MPGKSLLLNLNLSINGLKPLAFALATLSVIFSTLFSFFFNKMGTILNCLFITMISVGLRRWERFGTESDEGRL